MSPRTQTNSCAVRPQLDHPRLSLHNSLTHPPHRVALAVCLALRASSRPTHHGWVLRSASSWCDKPGPPPPDRRLQRWRLFVAKPRPSGATKLSTTGRKPERGEKAGDTTPRRVPRQSRGGSGACGLRHGSVKREAVSDRLSPDEHTAIIIDTSNFPVSRPSSSDGLTAVDEKRLALFETQGTRGKHG